MALQFTGATGRYERRVVEMLTIIVHGWLVMLREHDPRVLDAMGIAMDLATSAMEEDTGHVLSEHEQIHGQGENNGNNRNVRPRLGSNNPVEDDLSNQGRVPCFLHVQNVLSIFFCLTS